MAPARWTPQCRRLAPGGRSRPQLRCRIIVATRVAATNSTLDQRGNLPTRDRCDRLDVFPEPRRRDRSTTTQCHPRTRAHPLRRPRRSPRAPVRFERRATCCNPRARPVIAQPSAASRWPASAAGRQCQPRPPAAFCPQRVDDLLGLDILASEVEAPEVTNGLLWVLASTCSRSVVTRSASRSVTVSTGTRSPCAAVAITAAAALIVGRHN